MEALSQARPQRARRPWTDEDQRRAEELRAQGVNYRSIGEELGFSHTTIIRRLDPEAFQRHTDRMRAWRAENPEVVCEMARRWRDANPEMRSPERRHQQYLRYRAGLTAADIERIRLARKEYYEKNRDKILGKGSQWQKANPDKTREKQRRWREAHPDRARESQRRYWRGNPLKYREKSRRQHAARRSARRRALVPLTADQIEARSALFGDRCAYCGTAGRLTVDHVLAIKAGGLDEPSNVVHACRSCNGKKRASPVDQWYRRQPFFTETRWRKIQMHCPGSVAGQLPLALDASVVA